MAHVRTMLKIGLMADLGIEDDRTSSRSQQQKVHCTRPPLPAEEEPGKRASRRRKKHPRRGVRGERLQELL